MPEYRFYSIANGRIGGLPKTLELPDDDAACREMTQFVDGKDIEIWQGERLVAYFVRDKDELLRR